MDAAHRLLASQLERVRDTEKLYHELLNKRVPAVLNKVDHTIGFKCEADQVARVLKNMGYSVVHKDGNSISFENAKNHLLLREPHDGWNPVLVLH